MELIAISPETTRPDEVKWVNRLFDSGLDRFHLRKPGWTDYETGSYVLGISECWRDRIVVHQAYESVIAYGLGGWHFKDRAGIDQVAHLYQNNEDGMRTLSRSLHSLKQVSELEGLWNYAFLSPIFPSISKQNYKVNWDWDALVSTIRKYESTRVYALGGVNELNISICSKVGFKGVALLGALWESSDPVETFRTIRNSLQKQAS